MQKKTAIVVVGLLVLLIVPGLFFITSKNNKIDPKNEKTEAPATQEKSGNQQPAERNAVLFSPDPDLEKITPLTITRKNIPMPDNAEINETQQIINTYLDTLEKNASPDTETKKEIDLSISNLLGGLRQTSPQLSAPSFKPLADKNTDNAPKLTDQEIFNIIYPERQIIQLNYFQDLVISNGGMSESDRVVFDNESKIRAATEKSVNWLCDTGKIYEFGDKGDVIDCDMFKLVGTDPFFMIKKREADSLRKTGKLPNLPMSLGYYYSFVDKKSLGTILSRASQQVLDAPSKFGKCPIPEKFSYERVGSLTLSNIISGVKDLFSARPAQADTFDFMDSICPYLWDHVHAVLGCGRDDAYAYEEGPGLVFFNFCCHCHDEKDWEYMCGPLGCINFTCMEWEQSLWAQIGTCGCTI
jgi:hypothetical protein